MTALLPGQAAAPEGPTDLRMMYLLHHGFRRDLACFVSAALHVPVDDSATWEALLRRWDLFAVLLHDHHEKEDAVLWPYLRDRAAQADDLPALKLLDDMEAEHSIIDPLLEAARRSLAELVARPEETRRDELVAVLQQTATELGDHLSHEERDAIAILQKYVGGEEWADIERRKFRGGLKPSVLLNMLPWVVEGVPDSVVAPLLSEAPAPFRLMLRLGRPRFQRLQRAAFAYVPAGVGA
ncbi:hemerythrin domain-containing protein [Nocardioides sp. cx-169]|uniref:hemerythrin domain-containing protein n=1 Tax=Nocardioides sp. cx-169 TaxID=2899080 RepID=UPI001E461956|nr:hemerythrin domain-containing protein [Nocardioides sp. cx-169]MCD4536131.1 hemerythrin domain-containing protein [Nocardioides sp. cx-169]